MSRAYVVAVVVNEVRVHLRQQERVDEDHYKNYNYEQVASRLRRLGLTTVHQLAQIHNSDKYHDPGFERATLFH